MAHNWNFGRFFGDIFSPVESDRVFNSAEAQKERDWQEEMSNSAYQRSVQDMKAAGLNPAMMYGGSGIQPASTPSGSAASNHGSASSLLSAIGGVLGGAASLSNNKNMSKRTTARVNNSASSLLYKALDILA